MSNENPSLYESIRSMLKDTSCETVSQCILLVLILEIVISLGLILVIHFASPGEGDFFVSMVKHRPFQDCNPPLILAGQHKGNPCELR